ncbi:hypothetical protein F4808DRAFT_468407 [Astrocystis sublimbata]|nr:hypothetical protein F4808DRAFT_468406 [Astrocystis sublimbata]KAI0187786.1 hypothetical protein F4808DRAFT_468407 [Astrocystis sublimbata]
MWLYGLVFSVAIEATTESTEAESKEESTHDSKANHESTRNSKDSAAKSASSKALISCSDSSLAQLEALTHQTPIASKVVNELLAEWTSLTDDEIEGICKAQKQRKEAGHESASYPTDSMVQMITFKDCVGRTHELPFHMVQEWQDMKQFIKQMFLHVEIIGPHVQAGHYDIINPRGNFVLPQAWKYSIRPTESYTMHMWPMEPTQKGVRVLPTRAGPPPGKTVHPPPPPPVPTKIPDPMVGKPRPFDVSHPSMSKPEPSHEK